MPALHPGQFGDVRPVRGKQLPMFITPHEGVTQYAPNAGEVDWGEPVAKFHARKAAEAVQSGLARQVRAGGVHTPIQAMDRPEMPGEKPQIMNGAHRLMAAYMAGKHQSLVPVVHYDPEDFEGVMSDEARWNPRRG